MRRRAITVLYLALMFGAPCHATSLANLKSETLTVSTVARANSLTKSLMQIAGGDLAGLSAKDFVLIADSYGNLVSRTRDLGGSKADFEILARQADLLRDRAREKIRALENATGEDEGQLETLYRSDIWHDMNYALSAFGYWAAWASLGIAHTSGGERDQARWLSKANSGFQASSVRILYPGIVYGSWLGMGYVARARGDEALAEQRFRRLAQALVSDPQNPVREIAEAELTVLAVRRGEILPTTALQDSPLTPTLANVYLEEAFALLQQHRDTGTGAIAAAARLKKLIAEGYLNNSIVSRILFYRDEIAGQDLGVFSLYIDTEFAYAYQQYDTAVLKYRDFVRKGGLKMLISLRTLQYHYAVALLKIRQYHDALAEAEKLRQQTDLPAPVSAALPKLAFLIAQALYEQKASNQNRVNLLNAADYFLTRSGDDPDVSAAHLVLGELSFRPEQAKYHMNLARRDAKLKGSVALAQLKREIAAFNKAIAGDQTLEQRRQAEQIMTHLNELPRSTRSKLWARAVSLQMRTVLAQNLEGVLKEIDSIYAAAGRDKEIQLDAGVKQVLLWSKLRALDSSGRPQPLLLFVETQVQTGMDAAAQQEVYRFLLEKERRKEFAQLAPLIQVFYPALAGQTQDQRQLRLMQIRVAVALGQPDEAFNMAKTMVKEFPNSGDAWVAYAETAEANDDVFTAERAWAKITGAQPDGAPRWRTAINRRIELLARLGDREEDLCGAIRDAQRYRHLTSPAEQTNLDKQSQQYSCR